MEAEDGSPTLRRWLKREVMVELVRFIGYIYIYPHLQHKIEVLKYQSSWFIVSHFFMEIDHELDDENGG